MRDENSNNEREEAGTRVRRAAELQQLEVSAAAVCGSDNGGTEGWRFWLRWIFSSVWFLRSNFWRWKFSEQKLNSEEGFPSAPPCCVPAARRETRSYRWRSLVELPCWSVFLQSCWAPRWHLSCFVHRITVTATSVMATFSTWPLCKHDPPAAESHPAVPPHQNVSDKCFSACSGGYTSWNISGTKWRLLQTETNKRKQNYGSINLKVFTDCTAATQSSRWSPRRRQRLARYVQAVLAFLV